MWAMGKQVHEAPCCVHVPTTFAAQFWTSHGPIVGTAWGLGTPALKGFAMVASKMADSIISQDSNPWKKCCPVVSLWEAAIQNTLGDLLLSPYFEKCQGNSLISGALAFAIVVSSAFSGVSSDHDISPQWRKTVLKENDAITHFIHSKLNWLFKT